MTRPGSILLRALAAGASLLLVSGVVWVLMGAWSGPSNDPTVAPRCLGVRCGVEVIDCLRDPECRAWLDCMQECDGEKMKCPTFCGAYYQSPKVTAFTQCGLTQGCIRVEFAGLPACAAPPYPLEPLENADGSWWVAAIKGPEYVLFDDCQNFVFQTLGPGEIRASSSVPLTRNGQTRICRNEGRYTRTPTGMMQLVYQNWNGYREEWYYSYRSENTLLAHVCSSGLTPARHDYGTFVLSRMPLDVLGAGEREALLASLRRIYGLGLEELTPLKTTGCQNGPPD